MDEFDPSPMTCRIDVNRPYFDTKERGEYELQVRNDEKIEDRAKFFIFRTKNCGLKRCRRRLSKRRECTEQHWIISSEYLKKWVMLSPHHPHHWYLPLALFRSIPNAIVPYLPNFHPVNQVLDPINLMNSLNFLISVRSRTLSRDKLFFLLSRRTRPSRSICQTR